MASRCNFPSLGFSLPSLPIPIPGFPPLPIPIFTLAFRFPPCPLD